eukprot:CAMPEP_0185173902 /NCGR_PEP_ID=MMETSP1139-20130426/24247_1 /TAXON_ID=298111 /ORGANISM="Pavlova sp., Strain CCMP459" /LENGTH=111 /DNA_ID=CAMNT_0027739609 /DNA_START=29 /DNA_END=361 /DNA_ORIENTATION=+
MDMRSRFPVDRVSMGPHVSTTIVDSPSSTRRATQEARWQQERAARVKPRVFDGSRGATPHKALLEDYDVVMVGAGLSGAVLAERLARLAGAKVLLLDKRDHIGGNCYDYLD